MIRAVAVVLELLSALAVPVLFLVAVIKYDDPAAFYRLMTLAAVLLLVDIADEMRKARRRAAREDLAAP